MGLTKCNSFCIGGDCKRRKRRACECGRYASTSPAVEDACIKQYANAGTYSSLAAWEYENAEFIFNQTGVSVANYDPEGGFLYQQATKQQGEEQSTNYLLIGIALLFLAGGLFLLPMIFKK